MEKFNKKGIYLFAIKNLKEEETIYWEKEYEYIIYYFESRKLYNQYIGTDKLNRDFLVERAKGVLPKTLNNAEYMVYETGEEIEPEVIVGETPIKLKKDKFYCVVIRVNHIDELVFETNMYSQKIYEFETEKEQQAFVTKGENVGKLLEDKTRVLLKDLEDASNVVYLLSSKKGTKVFKKDYLLDKEVFYTAEDLTKVIFYPSLDTYVFNCHEDCIFEAVQNMSSFSLKDLDYDKFIRELKSSVDDGKQFTCKYIGKAAEVNPDNPHYDFDGECIHVINTYFKLDIIWKSEEIDAINHVINKMK